MTRPRWILVVILVAGIAAFWLPKPPLPQAAGPPFVMPGIPYAIEKLTVTTSETVGITSTTCRPAGTTSAESRAVVQVLSNSIYYTLHSTTAVPVATDHNAAVADWIPVNVPSKFRAIGNSGTATLVVTCFQ